jgi:D-2-hydroxyacid dehydrogenase (NADP+)
MNKRVLVIDPLWNFYCNGLRGPFPELEFNGVAASADAGDYLADVGIICAKTTPRIFNDALLQRAPRLEWIQAFTTGTDAVKHLPSLRPEVILTSMRGIHGPQMAEMAMMLMIALARDFPRHIRNQVAHRWTKHEQRQLGGKTVVILGIGVSGEALAIGAKAFGMRVIGVTGTPRSLPGFDQVLPRDRLIEAAGEADFLCLLLPWTPENDKIVNARVLNAMKPGAFLVNIARGGVCDDVALLEALKSGRLAGAALDVFKPEPLDPSHPFWDMDNVIVTPHTAGDSDIYHERALEVTIDNMRKYLAGRPDEMMNLVAH